MFLLSSAWISRNECSNMLHIILEIPLFTGFGEKHAAKGYMQCKAGTGGRRREPVLWAGLHRDLCVLLLSLGVFFASEKSI